MGKAEKTADDKFDEHVHNLERQQVSSYLFIVPEGRHLLHLYVLLPSLTKNRTHYFDITIKQL